MPFISLIGSFFVLLIVSFLQPIETRVFINQQHMHFVRTKEKVIQSTSATEVKELSILNLHKKELITTACEQLSSTEGVCYYQSSLSRALFRSRTNLLLLPEERYSENPISSPVLRTRLQRKKKEKRTKREQQKRDHFRRLNSTFISRLELDLNLHIQISLHFHIRNVDLHFQ